MARQGFEPPAPATTRASEAAVTATPETTPEKAKRASRTSRVEDVAAELRSRRATALAEKDAAEDASAYAPATPSPAKGALVPARKRPWAAAIGAMAETTMPSMPTSRPASPATPEADAGAGARESRARRAASRHSRALFPDAPGAFASPGKARAVASRQGDIRAMFAAREGGARARARAREPRD